MATVKKPDIIRKVVVINDDFVRKNRRSDGNVGLILGYADTDNHRVVVNDYTIDKNITLLNVDEIERIKNRLNSVDESDVIAHESQHVHNSAIGYHYLANSNNIYECMMLALADEMSAMMAGYFHKTKNVDKALDETIKNLSGAVRTQYITRQFANHFLRLQKVWGGHKNLYENKFDSEKIKKMVDWYFTIDGQKIMSNMSKASQMKFAGFMLETRGEIKKFITNHLANVMHNQTTR